MLLNKRLLIKNLLSHNDENSFYDKKRQLNLHTQEGKGKFLKHICALSNSNPYNNSYILVGVEDETNVLVGTDFYDDSRIQNLINAYLKNGPKIQYENIHFPDLPSDKVVGLVTIFPNRKQAAFKKNIYTYTVGSAFKRVGSNSVPTEDKIKLSKDNIAIVNAIQNNARTSVEHTLSAVINFKFDRHKDMFSEYKVFKDLFVVCWAGNSKKVRGKTLFSRVDIELINEEVKLFYSAFDEVAISFDEHSFTITEYVPLGIKDKTTYYPLEKQVLTFFDNGYYKIETFFLFESPQYNKRLLHHVYNDQLQLLFKLQRRAVLTEEQEKDLIHLPSLLMICYLNGFEEAIDRLVEAKDELKEVTNKDVYIHFKEAMRILRKIKYAVPEQKNKA